MQRLCRHPLNETKRSSRSMQVANNLNSVREPFLRTERIIDRLDVFLGKDSKLIKNVHNDLLIESKDGLRQFRMDLNHPKPHTNPHFHLIEYSMKNNKKFEIMNKRIYPIDVNPE